MQEGLLQNRRINVKTTVLPGIVLVVGNLLDGKNLKAAVVGGIPYVVTKIGMLTPLRDVSAWIGEGLSFTIAIKTYLSGIGFVAKLCLIS